MKIRITRLAPGSTAMTAAILYAPIAIGSLVMLMAGQLGHFSAEATHLINWVRTLFGMIFPMASMLLFMLAAAGLAGLSIAWCYNATLPITKGLVLEMDEVPPLPPDAQGVKGDGRLPDDWHPVFKILILLAFVVGCLWIVFFAPAACSGLS